MRQVQIPAQLFLRRWNNLPRSGEVSRRSAGYVGMYLLSWNEDQRRIDASLGGRITLQEARVLIDDIDETIQRIKDDCFSIRLDRSKVSRYDEGVEPLLQTAQEQFLESGASKIVHIAKDDSEAVQIIDLNLQLVLEGREEVIPLHAVA